MVRLMHCTQLGGGGFMDLAGLQVHFPVHFTMDLYMHFTTDLYIHFTTDLYIHFTMDLYMHFTKPVNIPPSPNATAPLKTDPVYKQSTPVNARD